MTLDGAPSGEEQAGLDLMLRWSDAPARAPRSVEDVFEEEAGPDEAGDVQSAVGAPLERPAGEGFQWARDREQALEAALRQMADTPLACVHRQLDQIRAALEADELPPARARALLDEVDGWLDRELRRREARGACRDERVREARSRIADALHAYRDLAGLLRGYLETRNPAELVLSRRLGDLAAGFLLQAREELLQDMPPESAEIPPEAPEEP